MSRRRIGDLLLAPWGSIDRDRCFFRLDHLADPSQALLVMGAVPRGPIEVRVYSEREVREQVQDLWNDEVEPLLALGRGAESFPRLRRREGHTEPAPPAGAPLQTAIEAAFQNNAALLDKVKGMFSEVKPATCPEAFRRPTEVVHWPLLDASGAIRQVPFLITAHTCFFGNFGVVQTTIPVNDPALPEAPRKVRVCSTQFELEDERRVMLRHTLKFTQVGFSFGLGFSPSLPETGLVPTSPKEKDPVFENGQPKKDPVTQEAVRFDLSFMRLHSKLKLSAWQKLAVDVGEDKFVCREG